MPRRWQNASLGELFRALSPKGVGVLDGFATTADAYWSLLESSGLEARLRTIFTPFDAENLVELARRGAEARAAVFETPIPPDLRGAILQAYERLCNRLGREPELAVRSSATAEDLPEASFAGAAETFLNVRGPDGLLRAVHACYSSLFMTAAIQLRARLGYDQMVALDWRRHAGGPFRQGQLWSLASSRWTRVGFSMSSPCRAHTGSESSWSRGRHTRRGGPCSNPRSPQTTGRSSVAARHQGGPPRLRGRQQVDPQRAHATV